VPRVQSGNSNRTSAISHKYVIKNSHKNGGLIVLRGVLQLNYHIMPYQHISCILLGAEMEEENM